ncbi:PilZ domain-containing protein [Sphingomonas parva]|uniref:PilZ domain-containing protein n=1 Tax=Sphingomonas parva TaxID=2555898 RepID=A0A4Y8ZTM1_9SPHN|nr:PilZ domain-containing protein [Sphingomonas parva]TFI58652.1 PilZ domain-containing protein [Sphingomonas parva]
MFINAELSQIPIGDGRKAERRIVNLAAALREEGARRSPIVVLDISAGGFKAEVPDEIHEGSEVWLKLPGFEAKRSRVIWKREKEAGCEFESPMHERDLELLVAPKPRKIVKGVFRRA